MDEAVQTAIMTLALTNESPEELQRRACAASLEDWRAASLAKVSGVGALAGLLGGPVGLALEAGDLAFLFATGGKACFGIGYILGADVNTDEDIHSILAIWTGAAEAASGIAVGKVGFKVGSKAAVKAGAKVGAKVAGKIIAKSLMKTNSKLAAKLAAKVGAKLAAKLATKAGTKWIPFVGGAVSAGINFWVIDGLMDAAEQYYRAEYVVLSDELAAAGT
jgi:hypothetical protein